MIEEDIDYEYVKDVEEDMLDAYIESKEDESKLLKSYNRILSEVTKLSYELEKEKKKELPDFFKVEELVKKIDLKKQDLEILREIIE